MNGFVSGGTPYRFATGRPDVGSSSTTGVDVASWPSVLVPVAVVLNTCVSSTST